MTTSQIPM